MTKTDGILNQSISASLTKSKWATLFESHISLAALSAVGVVAFFWPFFIKSSGGVNSAHSLDAPYIFILLAPLLVVLAISEVASKRLDVKMLAVLAILAATMAALRLPSPGVEGLEPMWFLLIVASYIFGGSFGFLLGTVGMATSALITGGIGPWLPFQMIAAGWVGLFTSILPRRVIRARSRLEIVVMAIYGVIAALFYGAIMNLWFWPFSGGQSTSISYIQGASITTNISHFLVFDLSTSLTFDVPRAVLTFFLIIFAGPALMRALRRVAAKGNISVK
ncbi:MAG: ECF transporter S component [Actinomycetota bacterium]|nr:ECF transporter S component [Actinomycetota bacterium]